MKRVKKRVIFVTLFIIAFAIYSYINVRGEYLQILGIGSKYVEIFKHNLMQRIYVFLISFAIIYLLTYVTTAFIKKGLRFSIIIIYLKISINDCYNFFKCTFYISKIHIFSF